MGMFDSLYDEHGDEWQTKAYECSLAVYNVGDYVGDLFSLDSYQVLILGGDEDGYSLATIRDGHLESVNVERDDSLPLLDYFGGPVEGPDEQARFLADHDNAATP